MIRTKSVASDKYAMFSIQIDFHAPILHFAIRCNGATENWTQTIDDNFFCLDLLLKRNGLWLCIFLDLAICGT